MYRASVPHQSLNLNTQQSFTMNESKCSANSPDDDKIYVDVTTSDPVYESIQPQPPSATESTALCITAAESTDKLIENPMGGACPTGESDGTDRVENIYSTIPDQ